MNTHFESIYKFNEYGNTPIDDSYENIRQAISLVQEEVKEAVEANRDDDGAGLLDAVADIIVTAVGLSYRMGLSRQQLELALSTVNEANLSKFSSTEEDAQRSVEKYLDDPRYTDVKYEKVSEGVYRIVGKVVETGGYKILKADTTIKPERKLLDILEGTGKGVY